MIRFRVTFRITTIGGVVCVRIGCVRVTFRITTIGGVVCVRIGCVRVTFRITTILSHTQQGKSYGHGSGQGRGLRQG